jgi:sugar phosphate isomerase/epimerase
MEEFVRQARYLGFAQLELHTTLSPDRLNQLLQVEDVLISSVHSPCPDEIAYQNLRSAKLPLSSLDEDIRRRAVEFSISSVELASRVGARVVVVHLGEVEVASSRRHRLRQLYEMGLQESQEYHQTKGQLVEERATNAEAYLEAARESLGEILQSAREKGILVGLENRVHYHEIPSPKEMEGLLGEFDEESVGYWHDVGHAEVQERLGFTPHRDWLSRLGARIVGVHLHDVRGIQDHLAPGVGDLDWEIMVDSIPDDAIKVFELGAWNSLEDVQGAVNFIKRKGI